jgi:hypothetical protein
MKAYCGVHIIYVYVIYIVLTSALVGGEWSASLLGHINLREKAHGTHWMGGWVNSTVGLDDMKM